MKRKPQSLTDGYCARCWCGEKRAWFSTNHLDSTCGGLGVLTCYCGGDLCICHNHGEVECLGCADCDNDDCDDETSGEWEE
jgi:hypothetical protein